MKQLFLVILAFVYFGTSTSAGMAMDTTVRFKVFGNCEQCKARIEKAVKGKGVHSGVWNVESKELTLNYDPAQTPLEKIENRIVAVGHDLENKKASDKVYNALPSCCHYRKIETQPDPVPKDSIKTIHTEQQKIQGVVLEINKKGDFSPLPGASVVWIVSGKGVTTDNNGVFSIKTDDQESSLVISYAGYKPDTIDITDQHELKIILASNNQLNEVKVTARQRSMYLSALNPIRTQIMTGGELLKAACCNLSESFETNPSVDVSYNDAVTGSRQIQLLGLSGNYTQLTVENLPGPRGIATALGLNSIAGPWVESIQLTKGIGSVANGYESIAGQINVELKKPENMEKMYANAYINDQGKTDLNLNLAANVGKKWSTGLLLHDDFLPNKNLDFNKDGFRDLPVGNQFSMINRWKHDNGNGLLVQFGVKLLNDKRTGGELAFDPGKDKYGTTLYGLGIETKRYEGFAKIGYVFSGKQYKSIGLQLSAIDHRQDSYFGLTSYKARQQNIYANLIYQSIINSTIHKFRAGISFLHDNYNEDLNTVNYKRTENVPGIFFEYTYTPNDKISIIAGIRADHNSLYGSFVTPRLHLRYEPVKGTTIRISAGRGQRTANIFAENSGVFVSSRQVTIITTETGKAYGLNPEVAWNKGISIDQKFKAFSRDGMLSLDFFRNDFTNQVVVDLERPGELKFYNLDGRSYSNSLQAELNMEPVKKLDIRIAYRYFDVKTTYSGMLSQRPLISVNRAFANLAYAAKGWKFDYTINYNGKKRIPSTQTNPAPYQRAAYSPGFILMNTQISKTIGKKYPIDFYIGAENLTAYHQKDAIIGADQPFGKYFDATLVWGPITGRMIYAGWRFRIMRKK